MGVAQVVVADARAAMAPLAARFYGDPTGELRVAGITGTNGKTTTAFLLREILESAGVQCGLLGTVKQVVGGVEEEVERTTPEAIDLQATFRRMLDGGDSACAMEVSSARAGPAPRRRDSFSGGPVHQPDPGPPRLPCGHGGLLPLQAAAVRDGAQARRSSTSTTPMAAAWPRNSIASPFRPRAPRPTSSQVMSALGAESPYRKDPGFHAAAGHFNVANALGRATPPRSRWGWSRRRAAAGLARGGAAARALRADRRGAAVLGPRRLRPYARFAGERAAGGAATGRGPGDLGLRCRWRSRPRQATADGPRRCRALRPGDRHLGQPALGGPRSDRGRDPRRDRESRRRRGRGRPARRDRAGALRCRSPATPS